MRPFLFLLFILIVNLPFTLIYSHEEQANLEHRQAIKRALQKSGCVDDFGKVIPPLANQSTTRGIPGATRSGANGSATRSGSTRGIRVEQVLPADVELYSYYFSQLIPAELSLVYGPNKDWPSHTLFRREPYESGGKLNIQRELGFDWTGGPDSEIPPSFGPTWIEFAKKYRAVLERLGIDPKTFFVPAIVLYKDLGMVPGKLTGKPVQKYDYKFVDPLSEKFPEDMSPWNVLNKDVQFNIPFADIFAAMQAGKFPLLDAVHDVSHFVSFLRFPEFAKAVRSQLAKAPTENITKGFMGREYWLTEALSLPDPAGQKANQHFLNANKRSTKVRDLATIEKELSALDESKLIDYSYQLAKHFESQLRDVSGGNSSAPEKWHYLSASFGMTAADLITENISRTPPIDAVMNFASTYFENAPVFLNANPKAITNETATFNFNTFVAAQKLLALSIKENKLSAVDRKEAIKQLIKFSSRTEAWVAAKPFSYQEWAEAFLKPELAESEPIAQMLTQIFNNDTVRKYYLGKGETRPPKK